MGAGNGRAVLTASEEGEVRSPMRPEAQEWAQGLLLEFHGISRFSSCWPAPHLPPDLVGSSGGFHSRSHTVMRRLLPQPTPPLGTSHLLPQSQALSVWVSSWSQAKERRGRRQGEGGKDTGSDKSSGTRPQGTSSGAGEQVLAEGTHHPRSWKVGMPTRSWHKRELRAGGEFLPQNFLACFWICI